MTKRLLFLFSILFAVCASNADDLWGASTQDDLWGDENKSSDFATDKYKTKEEKKAAVRRQAHSKQPANTQQTYVQNAPSVQQNTNHFDEWNTTISTETTTQQIDIIPAENSTASTQFDLIPVDNTPATENFDLIPVDNGSATENFDLIPVDNSTASTQFGLVPVEQSCNGTTSSKQVRAEQAKLAQIKAELATAKKQKAALDKAYQQKANQAKTEQQKIDQLKAEQQKIKQAKAAEQAAAAAAPAPQTKSQTQQSSFKIHWIPLSICAGVAITGGIFAVIFDNKASDAANRIPINHSTYKQSYDDAGNYQTKRNIAIGIAAAGLVGMGITFLF